MKKVNADGDGTDFAICIDWLSYTKEVYPESEIEDYQFGKALTALFSHPRETEYPLFKEMFIEEDHQNGRPPYSKSVLYTSGARMFYNQKLPHCLMELSGIACKSARAFDLMELLVQDSLPRITRIDIAVDIATDTKPIEVINEGISGRFSSLSQIVSPDGDTVYVGSRKSDRFLRIYRYNPPHPRSDLLRFEFVFKREHAVAIADALISSNFDYIGIAQSCRAAYALEFAKWPIHGDEVDISVNYDQRTASKTLRWIMLQVAPAFQKLCKDGVIDDPKRFLSTYFLKGL